MGVPLGARGAAGCRRLPTTAWGPVRVPLVAIIVAISALERDASSSSAASASVAPGVSAPRPGGLLAHQVFELVRTICADKRVIACDIMELAPSLEPPNSDRTARLAAGCLACMAL